MKYSTKLSDAVHIMVMIALRPDEELTSQKIATSIATNPGFVRQIMSKLRNDGLLNSVAGHAKPTLARQPEDISLYDMYRAVEGSKPLLHLDTHTNPECGIGINIQYALKDFYDEVQRTAEEKMKQITLRDIIDSYEQKITNFDLASILTTTVNS